jgi:putative acetyltransferase
MADLEDLMVRPEAAADRVAVRRVNVLAFGTADEADLVEALHRDGLVLSSIVAEARHEVIGHILFSRMWVDTHVGAVDAVCLAPMAVLPSRQRQGVGSALVRQGLVEMQVRGERLVLVVGHPGYYPRFGFVPAGIHGIAGPFPEQTFMTVELRPGGLAGVAGTARYPPAFGL